MELKRKVPVIGSVEYAKQALVGTLLGDDCLVRKYKNGRTYYQFKQGDVHLSYLRHPPLTPSQTRSRALVFRRGTKASVFKLLGSLALPRTEVRIRAGKTWCNMTKPSKGTNTDAETGSPESFIIGVFQLNP